MEKYVQGKTIITGDLSNICRECHPWIGIELGTFEQLTLLMVNGPGDLNYETLLYEQIWYAMHALLSHYQEPLCASQIFQYLVFLLFHFLTWSPVYIPY